MGTRNSASSPAHDLAAANAGPGLDARRRMTAADSWFLYLENPAVHLHVTGVVLLDPSSSPDGFGVDKVRRHLTQRLHRLPLFRHRPVVVPFGIDHPQWVPDPDFDIDEHLHHVVIEPGAPDGAFTELVGGYCGNQLDRSRPLWDMLLVEGLPEGRWALVVKLHHAMVDGITGVGIMADLLDTTPEADVGEASAPTAEPRPVPVPSAFESLVDASVHRLRDPMRPARAAWRTGISLWHAAGAVTTARGEGREGAAAPLNAPRTPFNRGLTARRAVAFGEVSLAEVKAVRAAFGVTVNDVVLAACTAGLRAALLEADALPDAPLVASVPVSVHGRSADESSNQVSTMFVHLPVHLEDPLDRLEAVNRSTAGAKEVQAALAPEMISDVVDLIPPAVFSAAAGFYTSARLAERMPPVHNLIVSNVPGSPIPLFIAGAELVGLFPFGPLMEGSGLNITVLSTADRLDVGLIACPDLVEDPEALLHGMLDGFAELAALAG